MKNVRVSWYGLHFGEEPPISGTKGSGTIFFCHCNLKCVYCQNWQISQGLIEGKKYSIEDLVKIMFELEEKGAHNVNLVSPTIWNLYLKEVVSKAKKSGLKIPVVWNSNGYEEVDTLVGFAGIVDIYLPDYKYSDDLLAEKYSKVKNYSQKAQNAILEMQKQVGNLVLDEKGIAKKGLIVRHLVLPGELENTKRCLEFIRSVSPNIHLSLMSQYNPVYQAEKYPEINRIITKDEYENVLRYIDSLGFTNGWIQEFEGSTGCLNPDFTQKNPFLDVKYKELV